MERYFLFFHIGRVKHLLDDLLFDDHGFERFVSLRIRHVPVDIGFGIFVSLG